MINCIILKCSVSNVNSPKMIGNHAKFCYIRLNNSRVMKKTYTVFSFKTFILLCIFCSKSLVSASQNWRSIQQNDTAYFRVSAPIDDSMVDGYARSIHLISTNINLNYESSLLPYSSRSNALGIYDSSTGNSWLGSQYILNTNTGEEFYFNVLNDTIKILTKAQLNDSWIIAKDTNGIDFIGTIISIDTLTIDGNTDSIKTISIQAYNGITPVMNYFNNLEIQLSKNHGFVTVFEFYTFPNYDSIFYNLTGPYPKLQYPHKRVEKYLTEINFRKVDLNIKYQPGNEWIVHHKDIAGYYLIHDSIISSTLINPNKMSVEFYRHNYYHYIILSPPYNDTFYHTYTTITDTVVADTLTSKLRNRHFESPFLPSISGGFDFFWNLIQFNCNGISLKDTAEMHTPISGTLILSNTYQSNFGLKANYYNFYDGVNDTYHEFQTIYTKFGNCIDGTKLNFKSLSIQDIETAASLITLYPNPSSNQIQIANLSNLNIISCSIKDITGKLISKQSNSKSIDISMLPNGLYFVEIHTDKGLLTKKIIKN